MNEYGDEYRIYSQTSQHLYRPNERIPAFGEKFPWIMASPTFESAINEVERNTQIPRPLIVASALTAISIVAQSLADVKKPNGHQSPTSVAVMAIVESSGGKSLANSFFMKPIKDFQKKIRAMDEEISKKYRDKRKIWEHQRSVLLKKIAKQELREELLGNLERILSNHDLSEPIATKDFKLIYDDSTPEALFYGLHKNLSAAGLISSEGGSILGGRAFGDISKMNSLWSGEDVFIDRKSGESFELQGARLTISIFIQEGIFKKYERRHGEAARSSGLWARFIWCNPQSRQGTRFISGGAKDWGCLEEFGKKITELLMKVYERRDSLSEKKVVEFSPEASDRWIGVANAIEAEIKPGGRFCGMGDHASKLADNISRVAALLHILEHGMEERISLMTLETSINMCFWFSDEFLRLFKKLPQEVSDALELDKWFHQLRLRGVRFVRKNYVRQSGPGVTRSTARLDMALAVLASNNSVHQFEFKNKICLDIQSWDGFNPMLAEVQLG